MPGKTKTQDARQRVADDLRQVIADAQELLRHSADETFGDRAREARVKMNAKMESLREGAEGARDSAMEQKTRAETAIKDNPWAALGIAVGVGAIIGALFRGRD